MSRRSAPTLLVVEDDELLRERRLVRAFVDRGYGKQGAASVTEALDESDESPEYAVVDLRIGDESGLERDSRAAGARMRRRASSC